MATGNALLDFGAWPGKPDATLTVAAPAITAGTDVEAWLFPVDTVDHTVDEHIIDPPHVFACEVVAGVGFTIRGQERDLGGVNVFRGARARPGRKFRRGTLYGKYNVRYVFN